MGRFALAALLVSSLATAQEHVPHTGFFMHGDTGLGFMSGSASNGRSLSGVTLGSSVDFGGAVARNWDVSGGFSLQSVPGATFSDTTIQDTGLSSLTWMLGARLTHYFMPANVFASLGAGIGQNSISSDTASISLNVGPYVEASVGKEWLVGERWGLGIAGKLAYMSNQDTLDSDAWSFVFGSVVFSVTLN